MKKCFPLIAFILIFSANAFCLRNFLERKDYFVKFEEKSPGMAAVLHVNFISVIPNSKEAEEIVKQQLRKYGNMLIANNRTSATVKKKIKYKNIIGSAWYVNGSNPISLTKTKIKFQNDFGAYVWIGKTKNIVTFPNYMSFLKKSR
ncbi:hypothetical protein AGMMS49921_11130 [Endomicrobiia bacterium]|nr:hypothetical protein AGMMS49921_11130 [Endomicrobiia bacterium]